MEKGEGVDAMGFGDRGDRLRRFEKKERGPLLDCDCKLQVSKSDKSKGKSKVHGPDFETIPLCYQPRGAPSGRSRRS